jgi:hypothetical protein
MPGDWTKKYNKHFTNTKYFGVTGYFEDGSSFPCQFFIEDEPVNMFGEVVAGASAYILVETKYVADIKQGVFISIGTPLADDEGSGLSGDDELIMDSEDATVNTSGVRQYYVLKPSKYGDDDQFRQVFLSKDKP